jgi:PAS domain S-box-containing protein
VPAGGTTRREGTVHLPGIPDTVVARTFPTSDVIFAERVREVLQRRSEANAEQVRKTLETALRHVYPHVRASIRTDVASFGDTMIYVFRDGSATAPQMADDWILDAATARVVTDRSGTYVQANERAERLFGRPAGEIVGSAAGTFSRPDDRVEDAETVWRAPERTGRLHTLAVITCQDRSETRVEYVTVKDGDGPGRNVTYLRELH